MHTKDTTLHYVIWIMLFGLDALQKPKRRRGAPADGAYIWHPSRGRKCESTQGPAAAQMDGGQRVPWSPALRTLPWLVTRMELRKGVPTFGAHREVMRAV